MKTAKPAAAWCLVIFVVWELVAAAIIIYYFSCSCCWPFSCDTQEDPLCPSPPCVRKCCPLGQVLYRNDSMDRSECSPADHSNFSLNGIPVRPNVSVVNLTDFTVIEEGLCPHGMFQLEKREFALLADGRMYHLADGPLDRHNYCLDNRFGVNETMGFQCFPVPSVGTMTELEAHMFSYTMTISLPFLVATLVVYLLLPELQNLHGKSLVCHVSSLSLGYVFLALIQNNFNDMNSGDGPTDLCIVSAFIVQFSFLATFFWLNIMCFDIWWVFSGLRPLRGTEKERDHKKFIIYSIYAWGGPLAILAVSLVMEFVPSIPSSYIKPQFGVESCWFKGTEALVLYFYLPIGMLVLLNILMFLTTALRLRAHTKETGPALRNSDSRRTDESERQRLGLYLKLFIVMGVNWVTELVSFALGGPKYIWYVTDLGNTLQGVLIFFIFVWKRRILKLLNQKLCPRFDLVTPASSNSSRTKVSASRTTSTTLSKTLSSNPDGLALTPIAHAQADESDTNL